MLPTPAAPEPTRRAPTLSVVVPVRNEGPNILPLVAEINNRILSGELYKALRSARQLVAYEQELMDHASGGGRLRQNGSDDAIAS